MKVWIIEGLRPLFSVDTWIEKVFAREETALDYMEQQKSDPDFDHDISYMMRSHEVEFPNGDFVHELQGYLPVEGPSQFPSVTLEELKEKLSPSNLQVLRSQATILACLASNAFPDLIDQYMVDAYNTLWANGSVYRLPECAVSPLLIPLLYPKTAVECWRENKNDE